MADGFPEIVAALASIRIGAVLDAELVVPDDRGRSDFEELRRRSVMRRPNAIAAAAVNRPAALIVFDVLQAKGNDLCGWSLSERKAWLTANISPAPGIQIIETVEQHGEALFALAVEQDFEGMVGKRLDAPYEPGPRDSWRKVKNSGYSRADAVVWHGSRR